MRPHRLLTILLLAAASHAGRAPVVFGQAGPLPPDSFALSDLSGFRPTGANWRVAGEVSADRNRDQHLAAEEGTGVLVNLPNRRDRANLVSAWEHADLELDLDFMMARESNSGIYLMGRYEVQLLDSWGVSNPSFSDVGGIYERWDEARGEGNKGFEGVPPRFNASRAPGLWQHLRIVFRAPRFDAQGTKTANARFLRVELNGAVIHENVEVTGPTRGALFEEEGPTGPLMIQGDHGPVAFRNIRYKRYSGERVQLSDLRYRVWEGETGAQAYAMAGAPLRQGTADAISSALAGTQDKYAIAFDGNVRIPTSGRYRFELLFDWVDNDPHFTGAVLGGGKLSVGGREVLLHQGRTAAATGEVELAAGQYPFSLTFYKSRPWTNRTGASLFVEGPEIERHALHATRAAPARAPAAIAVQPTTEPALIRSFVQHGDTKRTHVISVGNPSGVHYSYDLRQGSLLHLWRGPFLETTPMWHERGNDQLAEPLGSLVTLSGSPTVAVLADAATAWPDSVVDGADFATEGYSLDEAGLPTFRYRLGTVEVQDCIRPAADGVSLQREITVRAPEGGDGLHLRLAAGDEIQRLRDGSFRVGDLHYVTPGRGSPRPLIRNAAGGQELLLPVRLRGGEGTVSYTITW